MQKLVTIYLDNMAYEGSTMFKGHAGKHGHVEEHLKAELAEGWWIVSTTAFGGAADGYTARGWLAVVLEKNAEAL
jgi:hypothetical protein